MKINKRLLILGLALALTASVVTAASALAAVWKDKGVNVSKPIEIKLTGGEQAELGEKGVNCAVKATITTEGGSTGKVSKWEVSNCITFGELAKCTVSKSEVKGLPWSVTVNTTDLTISNWHIKRILTGTCGTTEIDKTVTSTKVTLLSPTAISEMEFLGEITGFKVFGSFTVDSPNAGTWGIG